MSSFREPAVVERLRAAAAARVHETSLRSVARQAGLSPTGLQKFLDGTRPRRSTCRKLERWFVVHAAPEALDAGGARIVIDLLLRGLPPAHRDPARRRVAAEVERSFRAVRLPAPAWALELGRAGPERRS